MEKITYRLLEKSEAQILAEINPSQYIEKNWRKIDGELTLIGFNKQLYSWPAPYEEYLDKLIKTINNNGCAYGAFDEVGVLVGFGTINYEFFGEKYKYVLLDSLFIDGKHQNKGIGKNLFKLCELKAKEWEADKIYICSASAERAVGFYFSLGCIEAIEVNEKLYSNDENDIQLEYDLRSYVTS